MKRALPFLALFACGSDPKPIETPVPPPASAAPSASTVGDEQAARLANQLADMQDAGVLMGVVAAPSASAATKSPDAHSSPPRGDASVGPSAQTGGSVADADRTVAGLRPRFRACYAAGLNEDPSIHGNVKVTFTVDTTGTPGKITNGPTTLPDSVVKCIDRVIERAMFMAPSKPATVTIPLIFDSQGASASPPPNELDANTILATMKPSLPTIKACYDAGLRKDPSIKGKVLEMFTIDPSGAVSSVSHAPSTLPDPVLGCIDSVFQQVKFSPIAKSQTVNYPISFVPQTK